MKRKTKDRTIPKTAYKVKTYYVNSHAVLRMQERKITKGELYYNLTRKPIKVTKIKVDEKGRPSYRKTTKNRITSAINPTNKNVVSVNRLHKKDYIKIMNETKKGENNGII
jgi:hypothetical protein